ncbi:hypothetical protein BCR43DRAFT_560814 [Syncephalastrum racemosum]|uniref:Uncharacterized protein n=1 Tax=Syncephalastrum racemosum TaxID=13706 RepID=A0A1X2HLM5_SYNRA|nr:hypothetical protein BCR43DRAFT_560814 [Syncephalastrum racemosum]
MTQKSESPYDDLFWIGLEDLDSESSYLRPDTPAGAQLKARARTLDDKFQRQQSRLVCRQARQLRTELCQLASTTEIDWLPSNEEYFEELSGPDSLHRATEDIAALLTELQKSETEPGEIDLDGNANRTSNADVLANYKKNKEADLDKLTEKILARQEAELHKLIRSQKDEEVKLNADIIASSIPANVSPSLGKGPLSTSPLVRSNPRDPRTRMIHQNQQPPPPPPPRPSSTPPLTFSNPPNSSSPSFPNPLLRKPNTSFTNIGKIAVQTKANVPILVCRTPAKTYELGRVEDYRQAAQRGTSENGEVFCREVGIVKHFFRIENNEESDVGSLSSIEPLLR